LNPEFNDKCYEDQKGITRQEALPG